MGPLRQSLVPLEPLPHAQDIVLCEAKLLVELHDSRIRSSDLQVDLGASHGAKPSLCVLDNLPSEPPLLELGGNREVVQPTPMPVVPGHDRRHNLAALHSDQEQTRLSCALSSDVLVGIVVRRNQLAVSP